MLMGEGVAGDFPDLRIGFRVYQRQSFFRNIISMKFLVLIAKTLCYHINIEKCLEYYAKKKTSIPDSLCYICYPIHEVCVFITFMDLCC